MGEREKTEKIENGDENEDEFDVETSGHKTRSDGSTHEEAVGDANKRFGDLRSIFREGLGNEKCSTRGNNVKKRIGILSSNSSRE